MKKGELTRRNIIQKSATIFNIKGYMTTTMNDIIQETNIQKGGIYRHFESKDQLMVESFQFSVETMRNHFLNSISQHKHAADRLIAFVDAFLQLSDGKPIAGGCPIINAAIEMDDLDGNLLLPYVNEAMDELVSWLQKIVTDGISHGDLKESVQPYETAVYILSTLEGGLVLERLKREGQMTIIIARNLKQYISMISTEQ